MTYEIRPLSFAELLDRSFRVLLDNFVPLISISAAAWLPYGLILVLGGKSQFAQGLAGLYLLVIVELLRIALTIAVVEVYLGRPVVFGAVIQSTRSVLWRYLGTILLAVTPFIVMTVIVTFGLIRASQTGAPKWPIILAAIVLGVGVIYLLVRWSLASPIMIAEHRFGRSALGRSTQLLAGAWWRTVGISLVAALMAQVPVTILNFLWSSIPVLGPILTSLVASVTATYGIIVVVLYYFDRRCRVENFDLQLLAEQVRLRGGSVAPPRGAGQVA